MGRGIIVGHPLAVGSTWTLANHQDYDQQDRYTVRSVDGATIHAGVEGSETGRGTDQMRDTYTIDLTYDGAKSAPLKAELTSDKHDVTA
ncbi:MAG: hypothetical protein M3R35_01365, partial [Candidatus Eremiobacteraeota bacterium]|nr:hypothetical protein [Candidatus Eremiobacteraeota bacterium]